jgi:hypothetical protein
MIGVSFAEGVVDCILELLVLTLDDIALLLGIQQLDLEVLSLKHEILVFALLLKQLSTHDRVLFVLLLVTINPHVSSLSLAIDNFV